MDKTLAYLVQPDFWLMSREKLQGHSCPPDPMSTGPAYGPSLDIWHRARRVKTAALALDSLSLALTSGRLSRFPPPVQIQTTVYSTETKPRCLQCICGDRPFILPLIVFTFQITLCTQVCTHRRETIWLEET